MPEAAVFLLPVSLEEVPTYTQYVKMPMDLCTIGKKLKRQCYGTVAQVCGVSSLRLPSGS